MPAPAGLRSRRRLALRAVLAPILAVTLVLGQSAVVTGTAAAQSQQAAQVGAEPQIKSPQAILIDADTNAVLFQRDADRLVPPASMSKLMVLVLLFMALRAGEITLGTEFVMSEHAWRTGGAPSRTAAMFVPLGKTATVEELIKGIIVQSANDAAISVAENLGGSEELFADTMTLQARHLGLQHSVFKNATGLHHPEHLMSVREIAMLSRYIIKEYPEYYSWFAQREFPYRVHKFYNRNPLLGHVAGVDGLKTGYIKEGGYGIAVSAKQDNRRLILVINGAETAEERRDDARRGLEWGFKNFTDTKLYEPGETVGYARVWGGERMFMPLVGGSDGVSTVLPRVPANLRVSAQILYKGPLKPPLRKGDQVATLRVRSVNDATADVPLYAAQDVDRAGFVWRGVDSLLYLATGWIH